jgi:predicted DNA-binding transcriptional regulator AlpA
MARTLIKTADFAEKVGRPSATIRYWRHIRFGPRGVTIGRIVYYDEAEVDAWIEQQFTERDAA